METVYQGQQYEITRELYENLDPARKRLIDQFREMGLWKIKGE